MTSIALAPSILSADFGHLGEQVAEVEAAGADRIHVDVMDGHLMIAEPDRYLEAFADAGADGLTVHVEGAIHLHRTLETIAKLGKRVGLAPNPDRVRPACELEVDGGIHPETARRVVDAGARVLVAASAVFEDAGGVRAGMQRLRASLAG